MYPKIVSCALALGVALFISCGTDTPTGVDPEPSPTPSNPLPIRITADITTKITDISYEKGDVAGLFVVNYNGNTPGVLAQSGNHINNMSMTFNGTEWELESSAYWADETTKADFYCYFPYRRTVDDIKHCSISVADDQSTVNNYKNSDATWGKAGGVSPTADKVLVLTKHVMSKVVIVLKPGTGWTDTDIAGATVTIENLKCGGTIDMSEGIVTPDGSVTTVKPLKQSDGTYVALIVPQSVTDTDLVTIVVGGVAYKYTTSMEFKPATKHTCTLVINRVGEGVNVGVGDWEVDDTDFGGTI